MKKRNVLITGGGRGIGKQIVKYFVDQGCNVAVHYFHSKDSATKLVEGFTKKSDQKIFTVQADLSNSASVSELTKAVLQQFGTIDIVVHNAGPFNREKFQVIDYTDEQWDEMIGGNLNSLFYLLREIIPSMEKNNWGRFITIGFNHVSELAEWRFRGPYAAAKTGAASLVKTAALEESDYNITVNMLCPGDIKPPFKEMQIGDVPPHYSKRVATGEDIARIAAFLSEENSMYISGSVIDVAGGKDILAKQNIKL